MPEPLRHFVGKVPLERALRRKSDRHGTFIQLRKPVVKRPIPKSLIEELEEKINQAETEGKLPTGYTAEQIQTIKKSKELAELINNHEMPLTVLDIAQAIAFRQGLSREKLLPWMNALNTLKRHIVRYRAGHSLVGNPQNFLKAAGKDAPRKVEEFLHRNNRAFTCNNLAKELGIARAEANSTVELLEAMGLVRKLPPESKGSGGQAYLWVHSERMRTAENALPRNLGYNILLELQTSPKRLTEIRSSRIFANSAKSLDNLANAGLVEVSQERFDNNRVRNIYRLTPVALELLEKQKKVPYLLPELRKRLLGEKVIGLKPMEKRTFDRLLKFIRVRLDYDSLPKGPAGRVVRDVRERIAAHQGISERRVKHIRTIDSFPLRGFSLQTVRAVYLPALRATDATSAKWLENFVEENPNFFPEAKSPKLRRLERNPRVIPAQESTYETLGQKNRKVIESMTRHGKFSLEIARLTRTPIQEVRRIMLQTKTAMVAELLDAGKSDAKAARRARVPLKLVKEIRQKRGEQFIDDIIKGKYPSQAMMKYVEKLEKMLEEPEF